jgi:hypothetical protein
VFSNVLRNIRRFGASHGSIVNNRVERPIGSSTVPLSNPGATRKEGRQGLKSLSVISGWRSQVLRHHRKLESSSSIATPDQAVFAT